MTFRKKLRWSMGKWLGEQSKAAAAIPDQTATLNTERRSRQRGEDHTRVARWHDWEAFLPVLHAIRMEITLNMVNIKMSEKGRSAAPQSSSSSSFVLAAGSR